MRVIRFLCCKYFYNYLKNPEKFVTPMIFSEFGAIIFSQMNDFRNIQPTLKKSREKFCVLSHH